jgi:acyl phosphate:glycerol-3-phosphate acyltransferase
MNIPLLISSACGAFLVGSFPTAWLLIRRHSGKDIRREGSGNVGALNAFEVSRSRGVGIAVLVIDLAKGALVMVAVLVLAGDQATIAGIAMISVVAGHNYSPWLGFAGGRGLATAAGAALCYNPMFLAAWGGVWLVTFALSRRVHVGNIAATLLAPLVLLPFPAATVRAGLFTFHTYFEPFAMACLLCGLIFLRHIDPLRDLLRRNTEGADSSSDQSFPTS